MVCSVPKLSVSTIGCHQRGYCWNSFTTTLFSTLATMLAIVVDDTFASVTRSAWNRPVIS